MTDINRLRIRAYEPYLIEVDPSDPPSDDTTIVEIEGYSDDGGWSIKMATGYSFGIPVLPVVRFGEVLREPIEPKVGDRIRLYGRGLGYPVEGVQINDDVIFYRTTEQREVYRQMQHAIYEAENKRRYTIKKPAQDTEYEALPQFFKTRMDRMRADKGEEFRADWEPYEMFCCTEAVKIANHIRPTLPDYGVTREQIAVAVKVFSDLPWVEQSSVVSGGHSGNTFGGSCMLARAYLITTMTRETVEV